MAKLNALQSARELDDFEESITTSREPQVEPFGQDLNQLRQNKAPDSGDSEQKTYEEYFQQEKDRMDRQVKYAGNPQAMASARPEGPVEPASTAKEKPPGGWLSRLPLPRRRRPQPADQGNIQSSKEAPRDGTGEGTRKQLAKKTADTIKQKLSREAFKKILASLIANPYFWIAAIGIVLIIVLAAVAFSFFGLINTGKTPSVTGRGGPVLVDPKTNFGTVKQVLTLAGEQTVAGKSIDDTTTGIKTNLQQIKQDITTQNPANKDTIVRYIDAAIGSLDILQSSKTEENASKFLTSMADYFNYLEDDSPIFPNDASHATQYPVKSATSLVFNADLHGNSYLHPDLIESSNVYITDSSNKEKCDAVDISVNGSDKSILPIFAGEVIDVGDDGAGGKRIAIKNGDYSINYIHLLNVSKNKGDTVALTDVLGTAKTNHIQLETMYQDKCLVTTHGDMIDHATKNRKHENWGGYLWDRIVTKFHIGS